MTQQLTQSGFRIAEDQPIRLTARTEDGESVTREYERRAFGRPPGSGEIESVTITPKITKLILEKEGEPLWQVSRSSSGDPGMIMMLKEGETAQDRADRAKSPAVDWIATTTVPKLIVAIPNLATLPSSSFAIGGVVDKPAKQAGEAGN